MKRPHYYLSALIGVLCAAFAYACSAAAYARDTVYRWAEPFADYFTAEPVGLEHGAILHATTTARVGDISVARSFASRRESRIVGTPALAFMASVPRQGGLIAA